jgi:hypothetical protein
MKMFARECLLTATLVAGMAIGSASHAASIAIAPGPSPAGGYLPLSAFGFAPLAWSSGDGFVSVSTLNFSFGGQSWSQLQVGADGLVVLGDTAPPTPGWSATNLSLPNAFSAPIIAPFWTDLDPTAGGSVRVGGLSDGANTWLVVDWQAVPLQNGGGTSSFQIWFGANQDDVTFTYGALANPALLTVGAQDATGTIGTNYFYNGAGVRPGQDTELRVTWTGLPITAVPEPATWAMMIVGFGLVGSIVRSTRRRELGAAGQPMSARA